MVGLLIFLSVVVIALLIAVLAIYLFVVGVQLKRIADNLDDCSESVRTIRQHGEAIIPGLEHINNTGGIVSGALPLLYNHAEAIIAKQAPPPPVPANGHKTGPASGRRRSRIGESVGYRPN